MSGVAGPPCTWPDGAQDAACRRAPRATAAQPSFAKALARLDAPDTKMGRYKAPDSLPGFLQTLQLCADLAVLPCSTNR